MSADWANLGAYTSQATPVPMRLYSDVVKTKGAPIVVFLRGGAFQPTIDRQAERPSGIALAKAGAVVLEVDYAEDGEVLFPQAVLRVVSALTWLANRRREWGGAPKSPLFLVGEEAGGNVAAGTALKARDELPGEVAGQVLLSPMIDPMMSSQSIRRADEIGMRERWSDGWRQYLRTACGFQHPYAAPCLCSRLSGVAPALMLTSEDDPLKDEALNYAERLEASGTKVRRRVLSPQCEWPGIFSDGDGPWTAELSAEFVSFVQNLTGWTPVRSV